MQIMGGECHRKETMSVSRDTGCFAVGHPPAACSSWFQ